MKKKTKVLLLSVFAALSLSACGKGNTEPTENSSTPQETSSSPKADSSSQKGATSDTSKAPETFKVFFDADNGSAVSSVDVKDGSLVTKPADPVRENSAEYTYVFLGWFEEGKTESFDFTKPVHASVTLKARYSQTKNKYTITFKNEDGSVLETDADVEFGSAISFDGTEPTKADTAEFDYTFEGFFDEDNHKLEEGATVKGDATYTAKFTQTKQKYTITFKNEDGSELKKNTVEYGSLISYDGAEPTKASTDEFSYAFDGFYDADDHKLAEGATVSGDATYTAKFTPTKRKYTITFKDDNGTVLETDADVEYGTAISFDREQPTKASTDQYSYTFDGFKDEKGNKLAEGATVTGDVTYTASYTETVRKYTITFKDDDGSVLKTNEEVPYGTAIAFGQADPTKASTAGNNFTFDGFYDEKGNKLTESTTVTGDATYTAKYNASVRQYTVTFHYKDANGDKTSKTTLDYNTAIPETEVPDPTYDVEGGHKAVTDGKWYADEDCTKEFDLQEAITSAKDLYVKYNANYEHVFTVKPGSNWGLAGLVQFAGLNLNAPESLFDDADQINLTDKNFEASSVKLNGTEIQYHAILHVTGQFQINLDGGASAKKGDILTIGKGLGFTLDHIHYTLSNDIELYFNGDQSWQFINGHIEDLNYHWGTSNYGGHLQLKGVNIDDFTFGNPSEETNIKSTSDIHVEINGTEVSLPGLSTAMVSTSEDSSVKDTPIIWLKYAFKDGDFVTIKAGSYVSNGTNAYLIDNDITFHYLGREGKGAFEKSSLNSTTIASVQDGDSTHLRLDMEMPNLEGKTLKVQTLTTDNGTVTPTSMEYAHNTLTITLPEAATAREMVIFKKGLLFTVESGETKGAYVLDADVTTRFDGTKWNKYEAIPFKFGKFASGANSYLQVECNFEKFKYTQDSSFDPASKIKTEVNGEEKSIGSITYIVPTATVTERISVGFGSAYTPKDGDIVTFKAGSIFSDGVTDYLLSEDYSLFWNGSGWGRFYEVKDPAQLRGGASNYLQFNTSLPLQGDGVTMDISRVSIKVNGKAQEVANIQNFGNGSIISINFGDKYKPENGDVFTIEAGSIFGCNGEYARIAHDFKVTYNGTGWSA